MEKCQEPFSLFKGATRLPTILGVPIIPLIGMPAYGVGFWLYPHGLLWHRLLRMMIEHFVFGGFGLTLHGEAATNHFGKHPLTLKLITQSVARK